MVEHVRQRFVPASDPRLGRHVNHDPRSRRFPVRRGPVGIHSVQHTRRVPIFDQGDLGSCTGNAALGCLGTDPFHSTIDLGERGRLLDFTEQAAVNIYAMATQVDPFDGSYPPTDTGSDGLSVAKVLTDAGYIAGYRHAFSIGDLLTGLMDAPCIVGTEWTEGMYEPNAGGQIRPTGPAAGGHEYVCDGYDAFRDLLWFTNSWGTGWAVGGRHCMSVDDFTALLARQGDATFFVPSSETPPVPEPMPDPDVVLADELRSWAANTRAQRSPKQRAAVRRWLEAKGL
jgi:hypothetical protein